MNDAEILRNIPLVDCDKFEEICKENLESQDFIDGLIALNAILNSQDLESLKTCELYKDVLPAKQMKTIEALKIVDSMRTIVMSDYTDIVNSLEVKHLQDDSNST